MYDFVKLFTDLPVPFNMIVLIVLVTSCAGIISSIAKQIRKYASQHMELNFKRELLEQGMEVGEIERIIQVRPDQSNPT